MLSRRRFSVSLASSAALPGLPALAQAQQADPDYPRRPVVLIVPYGAGGVTDIVGRALAQAMSPVLGQPVIVENKPGVGGTMGVVDMLTTRPDGYRLTLAPVSIFRQPYLQKTPYHPVDDLSYIACFMRYDFVVAVSAESRFTHIGELLDYARQHPGELDYGTPGKYTANHVVMVLLGQAVGSPLVHVPYKSDAEIIHAALAGHVQVAALANTALPYIASGKLRPMATASAVRLAALPQVPTLGEVGYPIDIVSPLGLAGPKGLPQAVVQRLEQAVRMAMDDTTFQRVLAMYGVQADYRDHTRYSAFAQAAFAAERPLMQRMLSQD